MSTSFEEHLRNKSMSNPKIGTNGNYQFHYICHEFFYSGIVIMDPMDPFGRQYAFSKEKPENGSKDIMLIDKSNGSHCEVNYEEIKDWFIPG